MGSKVNDGTNAESKRSMLILNIKKKILIYNIPY